jgi:NADH-quinone oxidoreductase subunit M
MDFPILSLLIWLPIFAAALLLLVGDQDAKAAQRVATFFSLLTLVLSLWLWSEFDSKNSALQFTESLVWIKAFSIH